MALMHVWYQLQAFSLSLAMASEFRQMLNGPPVFPGQFLFHRICSSVEFAVHTEPECLDNLMKKMLHTKYTRPEVCIHSSLDMVLDPEDHPHVQPDIK